MGNSIRLALAALALVPLQSPAHDAPERLGSVHFKVECNAAAQKEIDLAMAYYHSFAWDHYKAPLERALQADPQCGMAHFVRALGALDNPFTWPASLSPKMYAEGEAALEAARRTGLRSERERAYVEALSGFYKDHDKLAYPARAKALETGFEQVAARYGGEDVEATILYALVLSRNFDPADKQYTNQKKAAGLLEPVFAKLPEHPGVAHYLIHSYDYPALARQGLDAAKRYSKIAPDAAHALHMPSHIFTRVGHWKDSVESNRASVEAAKRAGPNGVHGYDYMTYAYLQMGQDKKAAEVWAEASKIATYPDHFVVAYGMAAMPARVALERRDWQQAAALQMSPGGAYPWAKHPHAEAVNAYARGIGLANIGDPDGARAQVQRLQGLRDTAANMKIGYWADQIDIQAEVVRGLAYCAEGRRHECLEVLGKAAAREDATEKHVVTPGPLVPAREVLASIELSAGMGGEALANFEKVLTREPNRFHATYGAARAAQLAGDHARAAGYYRKFVAIVGDGDTQRAELALAKRYLASVRTY